MKKVLAGILSAILGVFGIIAVDQTIETRVSTLEVEVSELREQVSAQSNEKTFKVGDEIKAPQEMPFMLKDTYLLEDPDVTITSASAVITAINEDESSYGHYRYPYTVCVKITGQADLEHAGKKIYLETSINDLYSRIYHTVVYATIAEDGTFCFEKSDIETSEEYLDALFVTRASISN